jgi:hypothetical protein
MHSSIDSAGHSDARLQPGDGGFRWETTPLATRGFFYLHRAGLPGAVCRLTRRGCVALPEGSRFEVVALVSGTAEAETLAAGYAVAG